MRIGRFVGEPGAEAEDRHRPGLASLAQRIRACGAFAAVQLVHGGPQASSEVSAAATVGPSAIPPSEGADVPRELAAEEIAAIQTRFAEAAARCIEAGFGAVEVHGAHGYLLDSFLSARRNRRRDQYGGSPAGRMRMLIETCRQVWSRIGGHGLLICRVSLFNKEPGEFTSESFRQLVAALAEAGVDILHLSTDGVFQSYFGEPVSLGQWAGRFADLPVIAAGGLGDPHDADRAVAEGHCDLAAIGNAMYEDPEWTVKARKELGTA